MTPEELHALEGLIDRVGIGRLLEAITEVCFEKREHVQTHWQDAGLARCWGRVGRKIAGMAGRLKSGDAAPLSSTPRRPMNGFTTAYIECALWSSVDDD